MNIRYQRLSEGQMSCHSARGVSANPEHFKDQKEQLIKKIKKSDRVVLQLSKEVRQLRVYKQSCERLTEENEFLRKELSQLEKDLNLTKKVNNQLSALLPKHQNLINMYQQLHIQTRHNHDRNQKLARKNYALKKLNENSRTQLRNLQNSLSECRGQLTAFSSYLCFAKNKFINFIQTSLQKNIVPQENQVKRILQQTALTIPFDELSQRSSEEKRVKADTTAKDPFRIQNQLSSLQAEISELLQQRQIRKRNREAKVL